MYILIGKISCLLLLLLGRGEGSGGLFDESFVCVGWDFPGRDEGEIRVLNREGWVVDFFSNSLREVNRAPAGMGKGSKNGGYVGIALVIQIALMVEERSYIANAVLD